VESILSIGEAKLVGVCDIEPKRADDFAVKYGAKAYYDYNDMLNNPAIDVINICTSSGVHAEIGIAAAKAGKHVIVEKPMAMNMKEANLLIKACDDAQVVLAVCHQNRFNHSVKRLRKAFDEGRFGKLTHANATVRWNRNDDYYRQATLRAAAGEKAPPADLLLSEAARTAPPESFTEISGLFLQAIRTLGKRTAEFHLALAKDSANRDFKPEKPDQSFTEHLSEALSHEIVQTLALLSGKINDLEPAVRQEADLVLREGPELLGMVQRIATAGENLGTLIRIHGDYHLGQVLRTDTDDFVLLDFEGEPLRPLAERRRKGSPLKDVAGMIRSFHYAAHTPFRQQAKPAAGKVADRWRQAWQQWTSAAFLNAYLDTAAGASFLPAGDPDFFLEFFLLEKVFYELRYELNNRPDWVSIPLTGIADIIGRQKGILKNEASGLRTRSRENKKHPQGV